MIALLCSVPAEAELLLAKTALKRTAIVGSKEVIEGTIANRDVLVCAGGMGKVNAAHAATLLLTRYNPDILIIFGIGGAYPSSGARIGDVVIAKEEIAGDDGVLTGEGFKDTEYIGIPLVKKGPTVMYNAYPASEPYATGTCTVLQSFEPAGGVKVHCGRFVTLSACTGTAARARELETRYNALCENMEGAAAAQVAVLHTVPWLEVRGISNIVEDRDLKKWDIAKAAEAVQNAVMRILEGWKA